MTFPRMGLPESFAWVRAPEFDTPFADCWESPRDGHYFVAKGKRFCVVKFDGHLPTTKIMTTKSNNR
jgi:hypothetical protein